MKEHPEGRRFECPSCGTDKDEPVYLVPTRDGVEKVHVACYERNKILRMENQIEYYINLNRRHEVRLRGKAFCMVDAHLDDVQSLLNDARGDEDELRNIIDLIKAV